MSFGVGGLMSGLDTKSIITQMMQLEQRPILLLQQQEAAYQAKISAFGALKGVLAELQTAAAALKETDLFAGFSASSANTTVLTASASDTAVAGNYQVTVDVLAQAQQVKSSAFTASDEVVGTGTLTIQVGTNAAVEVTIDEDNDTLAGIVQAINDSDADVTAGVINDGTNYYLTLASKETGASNTISLTMADADLVNNDALGLSKIYSDPATQAMSQTQAAANAELTVNGIPVVRSSNVIDDLLEGVTLNVAAADPGNPFEVKVSRNMGSVITKITAFVDKYNNALTSLGALQTSDLEAGAVGLLQGDSTPRILQMRLQSLLASKVSGIASSVNTLSSLGVSADKDGKLSLNPITFTAAYEANREDVVNFFTQTTTDSEGFAVKFDTLLDSYLQKSTGLLVTKEEGLQRSVDHIGDQVERIQLRLAKREENLTRQFNALESLLGQFQTTSGVLSQQLDALSNLSSQIYRKK
jgi:flagellar hook-associated protein 2